MIADYKLINDDSITIQKVKVSSLPQSNDKAENQDIEALSLAKAQQQAIYTPIMLEDQYFLVLVDCSTTDTLISSIVLKNIHADVISKEGVITSYQGTKEKQLGVTSPILLRCGDKSVKHSFEIANLPEDTPILISLDLFPVLGFSIMGIPTHYPDIKPHSTIITIEEPESIISKEEVDDEKDKEFLEKQDYFYKKVQPILDTHEKSPLMQPGTFCTIPESLVELPIPDNRVTYVRQYLIPHNLIPIMDKGVDKWKQEGVVVRALIDCSFNNPFTMGPKKDADGNITLEHPCLDLRHLNKLLPDD